LFGSLLAVMRVYYPLTLFVGLKFWVGDITMNTDALSAKPRVGHLPVAAASASASGAVVHSSASSRGGAVFALQARALAHESFKVAATAVATELALRLGCERVSIGFLQQDHVSVSAMSNTADIRVQQNVVRAIASAMEEALDRETLVIFPLPSGSKPAVILAHNELAQCNGQLAICTVPIICSGRPLGVMLFERRGGFDERTVEAAKDAALFVGPVLELKYRLDQPLRGRIVEAMAGSQRKRKGLLRYGSVWQIGTVAGILVVLAVAIWPANFQVVGTARVEGEGQRLISAPTDGFVKSALLRPGSLVTTGQVLALLDDRDLLLERGRWMSETAQLDKVYREALSKDDAAQIIIAQSKLAQAQAQLDLVLGQLDRMELKAPFDGVLLQGDLTQSLGMPVKRGQELMTLAPNLAYRVVVEVPEQDVAELKLGQRAQILFAALPQEALTIDVTRISPVATTIDGRSVFEVDGRVVGSADKLRPGLRGVARIHIEERTLGWVWWHRTTQWARRTLWQLFS
jgi:Barrel-sandwich domain of CusB or HlyD membrane-fusion/GAF domain